METGHEDEHFTLCECSAEGILLSHLDWGDEDNKELKFPSEFTFAMFRSYNGDKNSLWERIKYAAWHMWTGKVYKDQITFRYNKAREMIDFMEKIMEKHPV